MFLRATFRTCLLWLTLALLGVLIVLSVVGAFLGAEAASSMFNAPILAGVWVLLVLVLLAGGVAMGIRRRLGLSAVHLGAALVIVGGMWGSQGGHELRSRLTRNVGPREGYMLLHEGRAGQLLLEKLVVGDHVAYMPFDQLPCRVELTDADVHYYPDGTIREYLATLRVTPPGRPPVERTIEVNDPLHAGGYQFTLAELDADNRQALLLVTSDTGLNIVYAGFALLVAGAFGHYWLGPLWRRAKGGRA
jgi:hypothetical protein